MRSSNDPATGPGDPASDNQNILGAGPRGPLLLQDRQLIEKLARFNRERVPEGTAHPFDLSACGVFEVTNPEVPRYTRMRMFSEVGKRTEVFVRFSTADRSQRAGNAIRNPQDFAVRFYTEDGDWDLAGSNSPVFFIRDPLKLPYLIHSQKTDPHTDRQRADNVWDFFSRSPEATHQVTWLFGDRGLPRSWRHMDGYGAHAFQWINAAGERLWVKFHFKTDQGIECLTTEEAARISSEFPRHLRHDLYRAVEDGNFPSWTLNVQIMPEADVAGSRIDPFDLTKVWPHGDYPLIEVGRLTLDRLPDTCVAEVERSAFDPGHMVTGVGPSPDRMLQARLFAYGESRHCRLAPNFHRCQGLRGGVATGVREADDFAQAGVLYRLMPEAERERLVAAIAGSLSQVQRTAAGDSAVCRSIGHFCRADRGYGRRVALAVKALRGGVRTASFRAREAAPAHSYAAVPTVPRLPSGVTDQSVWLAPSSPGLPATLKGALSNSGARAWKS